MFYFYIMLLCVVNFVVIFQGHTSWIKDANFGKDKKWIVTGDKVATHHLLCIIIYCNIFI